MKNMFWFWAVGAFLAEGKHSLLMFLSSLLAFASFLSLSHIHPGISNVSKVW